MILRAMVKQKQRQLDDAMRANMQLAGAIAMRDSEARDLMAQLRVMEGMVDRAMSKPG